MKRIVTVAAAAALIAVPAPLTAHHPGAPDDAGNPNCLGSAISGYGVIGSGFLALLSMFGGGLVAAIATTHCDPNFE